MTTSTSWECIAFDGERVPHGENFVPGPDNCTTCKCEKGEARFCRAALCQPPRDCRSFRVGESCCDFICLDDILPTLNNDIGLHPSPDAGLRMVASSITAILSLALLVFLIHRLRKRKLRSMATQHQFFDDPVDGLGGLSSDSCQNNPYCRNAAVYLTGNDHVDFFLNGRNPASPPWKPPSYYFQANADAPPPYSEVVANDQAQAERGPLPSLKPLMVRLTSSQNVNNTEGAQRPSISLQNSDVLPEGSSRHDETRSVLYMQPTRITSAALLTNPIFENRASLIENSIDCSSVLETDVESSHESSSEMTDLNKSTGHSSTSRDTSRMDNTSSADNSSYTQSSYPRNSGNPSLSSSSAHPDADSEFVPGIISPTSSEGTSQSLSLDGVPLSESSHDTSSHIRVSESTC